MSVGAYKYIIKTLQDEYKTKNQDYKQKLIEWRRQNAIVRVDYPTNLARARSLGYKAKKGIFVVRVRVRKGLRKRKDPVGGRKPRHNYRYLSPQVSLQVIAEQRAARKHRNAEVINSYFVGDDGRFKWYEVILADRNAKDLDEHTKKIVKRKGRAFRLLTSAGRKSRGLIKGKGRRKQRKGSKKKEKKKLHKKQ